MALQLGATREAFLAAGVPPEKAASAAEELAAFDSRQSGVDARLSVLTWMVGVNVALTLAMVGSLFLTWSRLGEVTGQLAQISAHLHP